MRILSGIQPSGRLHIGNYFGAIRQYLKLQDEGNECFYFIANYHALTSTTDKTALEEVTLHVARAYLALGIDPEKSTFFVQSDVPSVTELCWILNCHCPVSLMEKATSYKDKVARGLAPNMGLFDYPVLQAADIMLYKAGLVPVGEDQVQHLELSREIVRRFNGRFGDVFPEPQPLLSTAKRILGLDGQAKMSKSLDNTLAMLAGPEEIWEKLRPAVTDVRRVRRDDPGEPEDCNLFSIHKAFTGDEQRAEIAEGCRTASMGCFDCKKLLAENLEAHLAPVRDHYLQLKEQPETVREILSAGAERCRGIAREVLGEARDAMGFMA